MKNGDSKMSSPVDKYTAEIDRKKWLMSEDTDNPFNAYRAEFCNDCGEAKCLKERETIYMCYQLRKHVNSKSKRVKEWALQKIDIFKSGLRSLSKKIKS